MAKPVTNSSLPKSKGLLILEYILFAVCLCVLALRTTITEGPTMQSTTMPANIRDNIYTLSISTVLIFSFVLWLVWSFCSRKFSYRLTGIEIGLFLFCTAAVISGFVASNKRLAITNFITLLAPVIMAVLLVQILDSHSKVKLLLCVIAALAVVSAYQSAEQLFISNQMTIDQYKEAPQTLLEPLGIRPGTSAQFLFEHRLYTAAARGFFTTKNSAGSFALLATFAAIALFIDKFKAPGSSKSNTDTDSKLYIFLCGIAVAAVIFALVITRSKGVIISSIFAAMLFILLLRFGDWIKAHKKIIFIILLLSFILGCCVVSRYGLTHGRLPGGNSMLVRWQYWQASAKMFADHPLTGVGPGNFANYYSRYKPPEAIESVLDPHNFLLSILTQYGPLGLIGFLAVIFIPLWRVISASSIKKNPSPQVNRKLSFRTLAVAYLIIITAVLLLIRPMIIRSEIGNTLDVMFYMILTLYIAPVAAFIIGFFLLTAPLSKTKAQNTRQQVSGIERQTSSIAIYALISAVLGVMLHNLIDFAIFEPPVLTTFCAIIAALIALDYKRTGRPPVVLKTNLFTKAILVVITFLIIAVYILFAWQPAYKSNTKILQAHRYVSKGYIEHAYDLLANAADDDKLGTTALSLNGRLYLQHYDSTGQKQSALLRKAEQCFLEAIARDNANYKNYEKLCTVYDLLGQYQNAYGWGQKAAERYPGSAEIQFELAQITEKLNNTDIAILHYKNAIDIEDRFRHQFQLMYPDREIVSRLGEDKYQFAIERIKKLSNPKSI